jgi:divalent metal cation (Fe/Co/Zn/Cd) transporter
VSQVPSPERARGARRHNRHALVVALIANAVAAAAAVAFLATGASVLLSEGLHSIADCGNQAALLLATGTRPESPRRAIRQARS